MFKDFDPGNPTLLFNGTEIPLTRLGSAYDSPDGYFLPNGTGIVNSFVTTARFNANRSGLAWVGGYVGTLFTIALQAVTFYKIGIKAEHRPFWNKATEHKNRQDVLTAASTFAHKLNDPATRERDREALDRILPFLSDVYGKLFHGKVVILAETTARDGATAPTLPSAPRGRMDSATRTAGFFDALREVDAGAPDDTTGVDKN